MSRFYRNTSASTAMSLQDDTGSKVVLSSHHLFLAEVEVLNKNLPLQYASEEGSIPKTSEVRVLSTGKGELRDEFWQACQHMAGNAAFPDGSHKKLL